MDILELISNKKIKKKVDESIDSDNKEYVKEIISCLDEEINSIDDIITKDAEELYSDISDFSRRTTLGFVYDENNLAFAIKNNYNEPFIIRYKEGVFVIPKKNGFNGVYINIVSKNEDLLNRIAEKYKKIKPFLKQKKELSDKKNLVSGKTLYDMYTLEYNVNKDIKVDLKKTTKNIHKIESELFDRTGWYRLNNAGKNVIGKVDIDYNVINAIKLEKIWLPYSKDDRKQRQEYIFIDNNRDLLEKYRQEYNNLIRMNNKQNSIQNNISETIEKRNSIIAGMHKSKVKIIS